MDSSIRVVLKPDFISWDDIHNLLWEAHADNRKHGINNRYPSLPGDEIQKRIGEDGKMLVALTKDNTLVGVNGYRPQKVTLWFGTQMVASRRFAAVLPEYNGCGVYRKLCEDQEQLAREAGLNVMLFDTHEKNERVMIHSKKAGYVPVDLKFYSDHFSIVMVKWLDGCPYPGFVCSFFFHVRSFIVRFRSRIKGLKRS